MGSLVLAADAPTDPAVVQHAAAFGRTLPKLESPQYLDRMTFHWMVSEYDETFPEYNLCCSLIDGRWEFSVTCDPRLNAVTCGPAAPYAAHCLGENSHNLGVAVSGMIGATPSDFGPAPLQEHQMEAFLAMCAAACVAYNLDPLDSNQCRTHCEWAVVDGYFIGEGTDVRWDFLRVAPSDEPATVEEATATAQAMRARCNAYKLAIEALT